VVPPETSVKSPYGNAADDRVFPHSMVSKLSGEASAAIIQSRLSTNHQDFADFGAKRHKERSEKHF
jgi:hypothetical protein